MSRLYDWKAVKGATRRGESLGIKSMFFALLAMATASIDLDEHWLILAFGCVALVFFWLSRRQFRKVMRLLAYE
jgi:hypothetical protein